MPSIQCPICLGNTQPYDLQAGRSVSLTCENCGYYHATYEATTDAAGMLRTAEDRAQVSGWIRDRWRRGDLEIIIGSYDLEPILKLPRLSPAEKANHLLLTLARMSVRPGKEFRRSLLSPSDAWAVDHQELNVYVNWLLDRGLINPYAASGNISLNLAGWVEVDALQRQRAANATLAFMAMPFGNPRLDGIVKDYFVPAAKAAGYELRRLNEGQPAGLIDDQLRVRLRTARFVVADLTDGNQGAYWEAGFAEGLGTPVFYTCERSAFKQSEHSQGTHFDTNHLVTVLWEEDKLPAAADALKAHIRATLPGEAKLED
jgi:hypothetical protein